MSWRDRADTYPRPCRACPRWGAPASGPVHDLGEPPPGRAERAAVRARQRRPRRDDLDGTIRALNAAGRELLGRPEDEVVGGSMWALVDPATPSASSACSPCEQATPRRADREEFRAARHGRTATLAGPRSRAALDPGAALPHRRARHHRARRGRRRAPRARPSATRRRASRSSASTAASAASTPRSRGCSGATEEELLGRTTLEIAADAQAGDARLGRERLGGRRAALVRARGAPAPRRRPARRGARQRHARARPRRRAALLRLPVPGRHRAHRGAGRARRQRGQARRGPAGRAAGQLGVGDRDGPRDLVGRALPDPRPAPRGHRAHLRAAPGARAPRRPRARRARRSRSRSARAATGTSTTASCGPTARCA